MQKNIGIVLKNYQPQKCKLAILDRDAGKIMAVPNRADISHGALIMYYEREQPYLSFINSIDIIDMPLMLSQEDITFVHHVLELCYYFIPMGSMAPQVFSSLLRLYEYPLLLVTAQLKKIYILQLFAQLGVYPEHSAVRTAHLTQLVSTSIDILATQSLDLRIEQELDAWLVHCVRTHPYAKYFKTINFLPMNKVV